MSVKWMVRKSQRRPCSMVGEHRPRRRTSRARDEHVTLLRHASCVVRRAPTIDLCRDQQSLRNIQWVENIRQILCIEFLNDGYATN